MASSDAKKDQDSKPWAMQTLTTSQTTRYFLHVPPSRLSVAGMSFVSRREDATRRLHSQQWPRLGRSPQLSTHHQASLSLENRPVIGFAPSPTPPPAPC